ncbi:MAG: RsiV family protein [Vallitalea sp.]|jgi:hypothetical protein|nr:RsiV family protein [Vallitalea sp.]
MNNINEEKKMKLFIEIGNIDDDIIMEANNMNDINERKIAKKNETKKRSILFRSKLTWAAACIMALFVLLPNIHPTLAATLYDLPGIGQYFKVVTYRNYQEQGIAMSIDANTPQLSDDSMKDVNKEIKDYIETLVNQFKQEVDYGVGHLDVSYEVVTSNESWFTLKLTMVETRASSSTSYKYYNIDKKTNKLVNLSDLFSKDLDYTTIIAKDIKKQMAKNEDNYYADGGSFNVITADENFYFSPEGNLVIVFDDLKVARRSREFTIQPSIINYNKIIGSIDHQDQIVEYTGVIDGGLPRLSDEEYTVVLLEQFNKIANDPNLDPGYEVIISNKDWFTLKMIIKTKNGTVEGILYYNIDKENGKVVNLSDLFSEDVDFVTLINEEIKKQLGEIDFETIHPTQNFYMSQEGNLVIVLDEGDEVTILPSTISYTK